MPDDEEPRKVVKKKVVKKLIKRPAGEGEPPKPEGEDDALAAFGITETKDVSSTKLVTPVAKPTPGVLPPVDRPLSEGEPKRVVPKKVVKKVVRSAVQPRPEDVVGEKDPELAKTVTGPATAPGDDGKKGGIRELLAAKRPEAKPVADGMDDDGVKDMGTAPGAPEGEGPEDAGTSGELLDDIDLDKITQNIQEDLLETFEEKIDDILVDIIDDEDAVEELTRARDDDGAKTTTPKEEATDEELDEFLEESEAKTTPPPQPKPALTRPPPPKPAPTKTVVVPLPPKPAPKPEVTARPVVKLEVEGERPKKDVAADEPVTMEKVEVKMIDDTAAQPTKEEAKVGPEPPSEAIHIDEGDVRERRVAYKVAHNFDKLPPNMRNELLRNLAKVGDPKVREDVVCAIATHFKGLPPDIQGLMNNLARDDDTRVREEVVFEIQKNFENISMTIRERILRALIMDKEPSVREEVVATICDHYMDLSSEVRELLKNLAKDKVRSVREELSFEMQKADSPVPKEVREEIIGMLKGQR
jgi:hypothetical protein